MMDFFNDCQTQGHINPRDAYSGGLTMAFKLMEKADTSHEISMFDIVCENFFMFFKIKHLD